MNMPTTVEMPPDIKPMMVIKTDVIVKALPIFMPRPATTDKAPQPRTACNQGTSAPQISAIQATMAAIRTQPHWVATKND